MVNLNSILLAFKEYKGVDDAYNSIYVWSFGNFERMFREFKSPTSDLLTGLLNTLKYFGINVVLMIPLSLFVAYFLYKKIAGYKAFRVVFFLPSIISAVVYVTIFKNIISTFGPVYTIVEKLFGYEMPPLLNTDATATPTIIFYTVWTGLGINMILYQGAMNRLPQEVIEAGRLDGISWLRELWSVVMPIIWPTLSMTVIIAFTGLFNSGGPVLLFSEAGSTLGRNKTMTLPFLIYSMTWRGSAYEYPAAVGVFFTLASLPIVFGIRFLMSKFDPEVEY
jgi:ABC-type sugar transport system permease subunit